METTYQVWVQYDNGYECVKYRGIPNMVSARAMAWELLVYEGDVIEQIAIEVENGMTVELYARN